MSVSLSLPASACLSVCLSLCLSVCLSLTVILCLHLPVSLCLWLLSVCLSVFLSVCLSVSISTIVRHHLRRTPSQTVRHDTISVMCNSLLAGPAHQGSTSRTVAFEDQPLADQVDALPTLMHKITVTWKMDE